MGERELYYTFGNHMHWVDMEWLWGYFVLPGSVRDMLAYCRQTGARGNVNFDTLGYERLAVEDPDTFNALRETVSEGTVEVVGGSYAQPYGLFQGGESNIRHLLYGVRTISRLFGVRPVTFWEEEFYFFPQLPQMLVKSGYRYASLFFQWTWHTPSVPREEVPAVYWEGIDGTRILTSTRNDLNLHQWPEDFDETLQSPILKNMPNAGLVQWLELMPSDDWMCRSEILIPEMKKIEESGRFRIRNVTLSEYLEQSGDGAPVRRYGLPDVFHGVSLGKNGDLMRRFSRRGEDTLLSAEALSVLSGFLGRPYPSWDVYPTWELEEAWRNLLTAQHHDIDECEGLCGHIGIQHYEHSIGISAHVIERSLASIARRISGTGDGVLIAFNPLGWRRKATVRHRGRTYVTGELPAFGYSVLSQEQLTACEKTALVETPTRYVLSRDGIEVSVDSRTGQIVSLISPVTGELVRDGRYPGKLRVVDSAGSGGLRVTKVETEVREDGEPVVVVHYVSGSGSVNTRISLALDMAAVDISYSSRNTPLPEPRMGSSLAAYFPAPPVAGRVICLHDHPYGVSEIGETGSFVKKYPTGDWMTSPQVYEEVVNPFTALSFVDLYDGATGVQIVHDGSQAQFLADSGVWTILSMHDPWDGEYFVRNLECRFRLIPHETTSHADLWKRAQEFRRSVWTIEPQAAKNAPGMPRTLETIRCDDEGVVVTALYRESSGTGRVLSGYAAGGIEHPVIVRAVEMNGLETTATLSVPGTLAHCMRTNLAGELVSEEQVQTAEDTGGFRRSRVSFHLGAREIVTLYLDPVEARRQPRHLDSYRSVWAQAHRVGPGVAATPREGSGRDSKPTQGEAAT